MKRSDKVHFVADVAAVLGEGPVWVAGEKSLYWVDIKGRKVFRLDRSGEVRHWETPFGIGSLAPRKSGGFIAGTERGFANVDLDAGLFEPFCNPETDRPTNRFNDGKVDRTGRFWAGTMDDLEQQASGALYRLDEHLTWFRIDDGYRVPNGPAFSSCGRLMYHNDSARRLTHVFDLDHSGAPLRRRLFKRHEEGHGYPDGMTVDSEDCLWIAFWDGWCVRRYSPAGDCLETIGLPVQKPTSCAFGGPSLSQLFVTSASIGLSSAERAEQPCAGGLFMLDTGCLGLVDTTFQG